MTKAIITGITGLVGSTFYKNYRNKFDKIYQLGRTKADVDAEWIPYDLSKKSYLLLPDVDVLFHFSGQTSIFEANRDVLNDLNTNVMGSIQIYESLKKNGNKTFVVYAGSVTQYGYSSEVTPVNESYCSNPITFYDISKFTAERYLLQYVREGWIDGCSLRLSNVYGGSINAKSFDRGIIDKIFISAVDKKNLNIYGAGEFTRDYVHVEDVASAFYLAWMNRHNVSGDYFNIGSGIGVTIKEAFLLAAKLAEEISGYRVIVNIGAYNDKISKIDSRNFIADNRKFNLATNWIPRFDLESGIRFTYKNLFNQKNNNIKK